MSELTGFVDFYDYICRYGEEEIFQNFEINWRGEQVAFSSPKEIYLLSPYPIVSSTINDSIKKIYLGTYTWFKLSTINVFTNLVKEITEIIYNLGYLDCDITIEITKEIISELNSENFQFKNVGKDELYLLIDNLFTHGIMTARRDFNTKDELDKLKNFLEFLLLKGFSQEEVLKWGSKIMT